MTGNTVQEAWSLPGSAREGEGKNGGKHGKRRWRRCPPISTASMAAMLVVLDANAAITAGIRDVEAEPV